MSNPRFRINKKFEVMSSQSEIGPMWQRQPDLTSCGYHLIHNAHPYIHIPDYEGHPDKVFEEVNRLRRQRNEAPLPRDAFASSVDLHEYFKKKGFKVNQLSNPHFDSETAIRTLEKRDFDLIYTTKNAHFTGIVQSDNGLLYLDSLTNGPRQISEHDAQNSMLDSLGQEPNGRYNLVGIVKKNIIKIRFEPA